MTSKKYATPNIPTLSSDQKLKVLLSQRDVMSARIAFDSAQRKYQDAINATNVVATEVAKELGIDPKAFSFDMDALALIPIE